MKTWLQRCALLSLIVGAGCVERRFVITSDPPGAIVYDWKGQPVSAAPADTQFTYYGKYKFTLVKDGYQTLVAEENVKAPWYEWFGLDFFAENIVPWTFRDVRAYHYKLTPMQIVPPEILLQSANELRERGHAIGAPVQPLPPVAWPTAPGGQPMPPAQ